MTSKAIVVGLSDSDREQLQSWIASIDPSTDFIPLADVSHLESLEPEKHFRLGVLEIMEEQSRPWRDVSRLRRFLPESAPLLVLIPARDPALIRRCVKNGADDYWIMPFNREVLLPRLQVLLEWASASETVREAAEGEDASEYDRALGGRVMSFLEGLFQSKGGHGVPVGGERHLMGGRWKMLRNLGGGSYGEVWLVEDPTTGERAVAKIPHSVKSNRRFMHEAGILKLFREHPNAVHVLEIAHEGGKVVLIQEFVEGRTLQEMLDEGMEGAPKEKAFLQLVQVMAYAHTQNVMHRDIKPENIIVQSSGDIKLLDFGTGKHLSGESVSSTIIGSRPYMSPEQIEGRSCLGSDVWALGVILYALSTGFIPFYYDNDKALMDAILECEPEKPSDLQPGFSPDLERIILRCLEKKPENRYTHAGELLEDLVKTFPSFGSGQVLDQ